MVKQHRLVTEELKKEIEGIHGLQVTEEYSRFISLGIDDMLASDQDNS